MDKIIENLVDPAWWFSGLFFVILVKIIPRIFILAKLNIANHAQKFMRGHRLKLSLFIRKNRHNIAAVNYQSMKSQAYSVIFFITSCLYIIWFTAGPLFEIMKQSSLLFFVCIIPLYIVEFCWLVQESKANKLIAEYNKVRISRNQ